MSGFIASPPDPPSLPGAHIDGGEFWPGIDLNHFRDAMRIGNSTIPDARLTEALSAAVLAVDHELADWRDTQIEDGYDTLAEVPQSTIGGGLRLLNLHRRAVYGLAAADLIETHRDVTATATGDARAGDIRTTADDHRRNATHALRELRGERRTFVDLV
jgi:hypothetical protein